MKKAEITEVRRVTEGMTNYATDKWLKSVHITPKYLADTTIETEFLFAQREAETLLKEFSSYLDVRQSYVLCNYLKRLKNAKLRNKMSISAAHQVLNIASKVNRKLFVAHKQLIKTKTELQD
jgi:hypothetical protein